MVIRAASGITLTVSTDCHLAGLLLGKTGLEVHLQSHCEYFAWHPSNNTWSVCAHPMEWAQFDLVGPEKIEPAVR